MIVHTAQAVIASQEKSSLDRVNNTVHGQYNSISHNHLSILAQAIYELENEHVHVTLCRASMKCA